MNARENRHTFFFVPVQHWGPLAAALGVLLFFAGAK
jgi:hypothetical protein